MNGHAERLNAISGITAAIEARAMTAPPGLTPHPYRGDTDRYCTIPGCGTPDRNPIHTAQARP